MELRVAIQKQFGTFYLDADFAIQGDRIGIFGPSGGGKSTLVGLLAGLHQPDRGSVVLDGETIFDSKRGTNVPANHRRISMVFQRPYLFPHLSVKGNLLYGYKRCEPGHRRITLESLLEVLQIGHLLDRGIRNLSGGERQRVAIGRAVLANPRLLIMDEPLSGLDDNLKYQIVPFLKSTCETFGIPYLFISHSLTEMRIMTERVLRVAEGRITGEMAAEDLARNALGDNPVYINLLHLKSPRRIDGMFAYRWGEGELFISGRGDLEEALFELPSTDIILFKNHPGAISARNLLKSTVVELSEAGSRVNIGLQCGTEKLVAVVVHEAVEELDIREGMEIYAAIKATAFKQLG